MNIVFALISGVVFASANMLLADGLVTEHPIKVFRLPGPERRHLLQDKFSISHTVNSIPMAVRRQFIEAGYESAFQMAEPGQKFQETDDGQNSDLPSRRLIFVGQTNNRCIICYERGGFAVEEKVASFHIAYGHAKLNWAANIHEKITNLADVRKAVLRKKIYEQSGI